MNGGGRELGRKEYYGATYRLKESWETGEINESLKLKITHKYSSCEPHRLFDRVTSALAILHFFVSRYVPESL